MHLIKILIAVTWLAFTQNNQSIKNINITEIFKVRKTFLVAFIQEWSNNSLIALSIYKRRSFWLNRLCSLYLCTVHEYIALRRGNLFFSLIIIIKLLNKLIKFLKLCYIWYVTIMFKMPKWLDWITNNNIFINKLCYIYFISRRYMA